MTEDHLMPNKKRLLEIGDNFIRVILRFQSNKKCMELDRLTGCRHSLSIKINKWLQMERKRAAKQ